MTDPVTLFPNLMQPAAKTYAPMGIKFWESEETVLDNMKEFADGWFERRRIGTRAALETARRIGEATSPLDAFREYQDWLGGAMARMLEDGMAFQQQFMKTNAKLAPHPDHHDEPGEPDPAPEARLSA
ncbi:hypothetical protein DNX69_03090 [Rhodopseudomonas palustris]|uniref:Phasin domain-containing protein n=1 Tax=Rhodopseudomonas palustris TaxID=1076 RepID=A0A323UMR1_RHOPL|nr:hypothetical protein [Rhodopseudomonas palustris]PZA13373.1 hypothetical protein DNX69_03090 [Rhodopseudomonas palustris]